MTGVKKKEERRNRGEEKVKELKERIRRGEEKIFR